jgi:hypothetical protein
MDSLFDREPPPPDADAKIFPKLPSPPFFKNKFCLTVQTTFATILGGRAGSTLKQSQLVPCCLGLSPKGNIR